VLEAEFDRFASEYHAAHAASIRLSGEAPEFFARYKIHDVARVAAREGLAPRRILDFGGGVGNSLGPMRAAFPRAEITLLDPSHKSLEIARSRFPGGARLQHFDGRAVPLPDNAFDLIFTACVFHHIPATEHVALLEEIHRVLAPGGQFFIFEHNPLNPLTRAAVRACAFDENAVLIDAGTMRARLKEAGFVRMRTEFRIFLPHALAALRPLERFLADVPLGAQYFVHARKPGV